MTRPGLDLQLMTIEEAAAMLHSSIAPSTLPHARRTGELWAQKIGARYYTTAAAVEEYLQCPAPASRPASTSAAMKANGSSAMAPPSDGRALALASAERLKRRSQTTSQPESRRPAEVRRIRES